MMKRILVALVIVAILAVLSLYWTSKHHVVRTESGLAVLDKRFLTFKDTYVDVREWSYQDFKAHPDLKEALINQGYEDMLAELRKEEFEESVREISEQFTREFEESIPQLSEKFREEMEEFEQTIPELSVRIMEEIQRALDDFISIVEEATPPDGEEEPGDVIDETEEADPQPNAS